MEKDDFKQKTNDLLDELKDFINNLEHKADEIADNAKEEYYQQLNNLKGIRDNLASKLDEYENITDTKWDVIKDSATSFFGSVAEAWKENFNKAVEAFKKK